MAFLNRQQLEATFDEVYFDLDKLLIECVSFRREVDKKRDGYNFFKKGDLYQYLILPLKGLQPKTYSLLMQGQFFYAIKKTKFPVRIMGDITQFGILVNDKAFYIDYTEDSYAEDPVYFDFHNIPDFLLNSWLYRTEKWSIAEDSTTSVYKSRLPSTLKMPMHSIISGFEENIDKYADFLTTKFKHEFRRNYEDDKYNDMEKYFQLLCLLDTRNIDEFSEQSGFQLWLSSHNNNNEIYVTQNADVFTIKKLVNEREAIDSYGAHIFGIEEGEFDFTPYLVDF